MGLVALARIQMSLVTRKKMRMGLGTKKILPRLILMTDPAHLTASAMALKVPVQVLPNRRPLPKKAVVFLSIKQNPFRFLLVAMWSTMKITSVSTMMQLLPISSECWIGWQRKLRANSWRMNASGS